MSDLVLPVKREYFEQIKSGIKTKEYRLVNEYWSKRLSFRKARGLPEFKRVIITLGYPPKTDKDRRLVFPYRGFCEQTIKHKHFGIHPVRVYAIALEAV